jgi:ribosomal 50S subunit-associated protein YjgA (DUF615 family)
MQNEKLKKDWGLLMFRAKPHFEQTQNLTRHLMSFPHRELVNMSPVMPETLAAMRQFIPRIPPKHQTEFRRQLAYLTELRDLQAEAWGWAIDRAQAEANENSEALKKLTTWE